MRFFRKLITISIILAYPLHVFGVEETRINTQAQFDAAIERINKGEEMHLNLASRRFLLNGSINAKSPLSIVGNGATITSLSDTYSPKEAYKVTETHVVYRIKKPLSLFPLFFDDKGDLYRVSESVIDSVGVNYAEGDFVVPEGFSAGSQLQIPIPKYLKHLKNKVFSDAFGYFDCGWQVINFKLSRSDNKYFYCSTLNACSTKNFQFDKKTYKKPIRFVIYNAELKRNSIFYDKEFLYVPKSIGQLNCINRVDIYKQTPTLTTQSDIILDDLKFMGFDGIRVVSNANNKCEITNCHFQNCIGYALMIQKKGDTNLETAKVDKCTFINCAVQNDHIVRLFGTYTGRTSVSLSNCTITRYRDGVVMYKNSVGSVSVDGDVSISRNVMYNSPRGHLFLKRGEIIVTENFLYNSDTFNSAYDRNICSDWGLIYCNHIFSDTESALNNSDNKILLERNLLYGAYSYGNQARGIYIDDGRGDVECRDNVILNTQSYSIDSRNVTLTDASSARNQYIGNIVTSRYQLFAGPAVNGKNKPVTHGNILLDPRENVTSGIGIVKEDSRFDIDTDCSFKDGKVLVSRALYKKIKKSPAWRSNKKYVGKK